ncbi:NXPE family member 3-like [Cebidichthys violaceus]|uniref:NXPE family member 3-like n=1 Tax=Cebidichthys violaceus TaxID=271503 RepID=UPI0035CA7492
METSPSGSGLNSSTQLYQILNLHSLKQAGPYISLDYANNILVTYRCHEPPIHFRSHVNKRASLHCFVTLLDDLTGGPNTVVVFGIWAHFGTFPMEIYIRRLQSICRAVVRLLDTAPDTLVVIRTANLRFVDLFVTLLSSDWYGVRPWLSGEQGRLSISGSAVRSPATSLMSMCP